MDDFFVVDRVVQEHETLGDLFGDVDAFAPGHRVVAAVVEDIV